MRKCIISWEREPEGRQACSLVDSAGQYFIKNPGLFCFLFLGHVCSLVFVCLLCWPQPKLNSRSRAPLITKIKATDFTTYAMTLKGSARALPPWPCLPLSSSSSTILFLFQSHWSLCLTFASGLHSGSFPQPRMLFPHITYPLG